MKFHDATTGGASVVAAGAAVGASADQVPHGQRGR